MLEFEGKWVIWNGNEKLMASYNKRYKQTALRVWM
jgi:hypothetical protein